MTLPKVGKEIIIEFINFLSPLNIEISFITDKILIQRNTNKFPQSLCLIFNH